MWDWYPETDPDFMLSVLTCGSWSVWNDTGYCSKQYDNLYSAQSAAMNPAQRQQIVYQMQQMIAKARTVPGDRLPGLDRGAQPQVGGPDAGGRHVVDVPVDDPVRLRAPGRLSPPRPASARRRNGRRAVVRRADYVIKRGFFALVTIFVAITLNFFLFRVLPGSAVTNLARVPSAGPRCKHALTVEFGLDKPKWQQYVLYLRELAHGNMGISFANQQPVSHLLLADLKNTIPMVTVGTVASIIVGVFTGVLAAWRRGSVADHISTNAGGIRVRVPDPVARADAADPALPAPARPTE